MTKKFIILALTLMLAALLLPACKPIEENAEIRTLTEAYLAKATTGDEEGTSSLVTTQQNVSQALFLMQSVGEFELHQVEARIEIAENAFARATYLMTAGDRTFTVKASYYGGNERLHDVEIIETTWAKNHAAEKQVLNIILRIYSLLSFAFLIWMIVDCARRELKHKILWFVLIVLGIAFSSIYGGETAKATIHFGIQLRMSGISLDMIEGTAQTFVSVPVGAIIYFAIRKRFTKTKAE